MALTKDEAGTRNAADEIDRKLESVANIKEEIQAEHAAEAQEKLEAAKVAKVASQLSLGFFVDREVETTFRGSVKLQGIPELTEHEDVRFEGVGHLQEFRVKDKDGSWRLQQVIVPSSIEVFCMRGKTIKKKKFKD